MRTPTALALLILSFNSAYASELTGEALALACQGNVPGVAKPPNSARHLDLCHAYINGWDDARASFLRGTRTYCPPRVTVKDMSVVFFDYMAARKEAWDLPAADALMLAFKQKWPCQD